MFPVLQVGWQVDLELILQFHSGLRNNVWFWDCCGLDRWKLFAGSFVVCEKMDSCLILRATLFGLMLLGLLSPART